MFFHIIYHVLTIYIFILLCFKKVFEHVLKIEDQFSTYQAVIPNDCNTTEECKNVESMLMLMFEMTGNRQHFGHLLSFSFAPSNIYQNASSLNNISYSILISTITD